MRKLILFFAAFLLFCGEGFAQKVIFDSNLAGSYRLNDTRAKI